MLRPPPSSTLFPYTTLFRSVLQRRERKPAHRLAKLRQLVAAADGALGLVGHAEDVRDQHVAAGVEQLERLGEGRIQRSEEHTSELQSQFHLVCRLLLEKKKQ